MKTLNKTVMAVATFILGLTGSISQAESKPDYLLIKDAEVEVESKGSHKTLELEIKTQAKIPDDGKAGAFGYGALTDGGNNVLVLVTHLPIDDSSYENPTNGFHTHVLDLKAPTEACNKANFEVDLDNSGKNKAFDADYKWKVKGNQASVEGVPVEDLGDAGVEAVVSFILHPVLDEAKKPTNLCVHVVEQK